MFRVTIVPGRLVERGWRRVALAGVLCAGALLALTAPFAHADSPLAWSNLGSVDTQQVPVGMSGLSCPTSSLCVGIDGRGNVAVSANPVVAQPIWSAATIVGGFPLHGVSCPSASLCVAVGSDSNGSQVLSSAAPTGGPGSWNVATLASLAGTTTELQSISCVASLCVAGGSGSVGGVGEIATSTNPSAGADAWTVVSVPTNSYISAVSCVSTSLCVAVDTGGDVLTSTDPTAGSSAWTVTHLAGEADFEGVSCPSSTICVAVDAFGNVVTSTDPTGGSGAWTVTGGTDPDPYGYSGVSCASTTLCAAVDDEGHVVTATNPTGGVGAWTATSVDGSADLERVSCVPDSSSCVAGAGGGDGTGAGDVVDSTNSAGGAGAWTVVPNADGLTWAGGPHNTINAVSCLPSPLCVAVDDAGNVVASANPAAGAGAWTLSDVDGSTAINDVSCLPGPLCVAVDAAGNVLTSTDPTGGSGAWTRTDINGANPILTISCIAGPLCVAGGDYSNALTSTDPTGGAAAWTINDLGSKTPGLLSCPTTTLCVGVAMGINQVTTSTDPTGDAAAWTVWGDLPYGNRAEGISCLASSLCLAVDDDGHVSWTTDPFGPNGSTWTANTVEPSSGGPGTFVPFSGVTCQSATLCLATDILGRIATTTNPTGPASAWTITPTGANALTSVSCAAASLCVAAGQDGYVIVGTNTPPAAPPPPVTPPPPNPPTNPPTAGPARFALSLAIAGSGHGTVTGPGVDCTATCTLNLPGGQLKLSATAAKGSDFVGWEGACSGTDGCTFALSGPVTLTARFAAVAPGATINATHVAGTDASFTLAATGSSSRLQCALERTDHARPKKIAYVGCGHRVSFRHLASGTYVLYVRGISPNGARSGPITHRFRVG